MAKSKKRSIQKNTVKMPPSSMLAHMAEAEEKLKALEEAEEAEKAAETEAAEEAPAKETAPKEPEKDTEKEEMYKILRRLMDDMGASTLSALSEMIDRAEISKLIRAHGMDEASARLFLAQQEKVRALREAEELARREADYADMRQNPLYADVDERRAAMEAFIFRTGLSPREAYNALFAEERLEALLRDVQKEAVEKERKAKRIPALSGGAAPDKKGSAGLSEAEAWAAARAGLSREEYAKYKYAY